MAEFTPPEDNRYVKESIDSISVNGVELDLSDYLTVPEASNLYVSKSTLTKYSTKEETTSLLQPITNDIDALENQTNEIENNVSLLETEITSVKDTTKFFKKVDDQTLKITGDLQLDSGSITELSHQGR